MKGGNRSETPAPVLPTNADSPSGVGGRGLRPAQALSRFTFVDTQQVSCPSVSHNLPFVLCLQAHSHFHILIFLSFFQSGRDERKLPEEGDQPGQARNATECREAKPLFFQRASCGERQVPWDWEGRWTAKWACGQGPQWGKATSPPGVLHNVTTDI